MGFSRKIVEMTKKFLEISGNFLEMFRIFHRNVYEIPRKHFIDRWYVLFHIKHKCIVVFVFR